MQPVLNPRYSLIIPVYRNAENIDELVPACQTLHEALNRRVDRTDGNADIPVGADASVVQAFVHAALIRAECAAAL